MGMTADSYVCYGKLLYSNVSELWCCEEFQGCWETFLKAKGIGGIGLAEIQGHGGPWFMYAQEKDRNKTPFFMAWDGGIGIVDFELTQAFDTDKADRRIESVCNQLGLEYTDPSWAVFSHTS